MGLRGLGGLPMGAKRDTLTDWETLGESGTDGDTGTGAMCDALVESGGTLGVSGTAEDFEACLGDTAGISRKWCRPDFG